MILGPDSLLQQQQLSSVRERESPHTLSLPANLPGLHFLFGPPWPNAMLSRSTICLGCIVEPGARVAVGTELGCFTPSSTSVASDRVLVWRSPDSSLRIQLTPLFPHGNLYILISIALHPRELHTLCPLPLLIRNDWVVHVGTKIHELHKNQPNEDKRNDDIPRPVHQKREESDLSSVEFKW